MCGMNIGEIYNEEYAKFVDISLVTLAPLWSQRACRENNFTTKCMREASTKSIVPLLAMSGILGDKLLLQVPMNNTGRQVRQTVGRYCFKLSIEAWHGI